MCVKPVAGLAFYLPAARGIHDFFQEEDGIRDHCVDEVQTCALFFSSRRRHTRSLCDWSSDVCSSDLYGVGTGRDGKAAQGIAPRDGSEPAWPRVAMP